MKQAEPAKIDATVDCGLQTEDRQL